jgi:hypothetical protein
MISTPNIKGSWFHKMFQAGLEENSEGIQSFHCPTSINPYIPTDEIEQARNMLPENSFRREYEAVYIDSGGEVFQNIDACIIDGRCTCENASTSLGLDLARTHDFTVLTELCTNCRRVRNIHRFNQIDWGTQKRMILDLYNNIQRYSTNISCTVDSSGIGDVVYQDLQESGMPVISFKFTSGSKNQLISNLRAKISTKSICWSPNIENADILGKELAGYLCEMSSSGNISYRNGGTPNDDTVISLALACQNMGNYITPSTNCQDDNEEVDLVWGDNTWSFDE